MSQEPDTRTAPVAPATSVRLTVACAGGRLADYQWAGGSAVKTSSPFIDVNPLVSTFFSVAASNSGGVAVATTQVQVEADPSDAGTPDAGTPDAGTPDAGTPDAGTTPDPGFPPGSCTLTANPTSHLGAGLAAGTQVQLTAWCATGTAPISFTWNNGTVASVLTDAPVTTTTYSVVASNGYGSAPSMLTTVQVNTVTPAQNFCTSSDQLITVPWPASGQVRPSTSGFANQVVAFKMTVPFTFSPPLNVTHLGFMRIAEVPGQAVTGRELTVSRNACDFQSGNYLIAGLGTGDTAPGVNYTVNNPGGYIAAGGQFNLQSGDTVYLNLRNANNGVLTCPDPTCNILFDWATPNRY